MLRTVVIWACLALAACGADSPPAQAKRVALVVGISDYQYSPKLANPRNDAGRMVEELDKLGFDVTAAIDADRRALIAALDRFYDAARGAEAALFYYAGHALQARGVNFLVPADAELRSEPLLKHEAIALQDIVTTLEERATFTIAFLDACRDNPLATKLQRSIVANDRSLRPPEGLAPMGGGSGDTYIVFSAKPGATAADGTDGHSPFTAALLKHVSTPGLEIDDMMGRVTKSVAAATGRRQVPARQSQLTQAFYLNPRNFGVAPSINSSRPSVPADPSAGSGQGDLCAGSNPSVACLFTK